MYFKIRRRKFGHLVIASATTMVMANFTGKSLAQMPSSTLYSVSFAQTSKNKQNKPNDKLDSEDLANRTPEVAIASEDLFSGQPISKFNILENNVDNPQDSTEAADKAVFTTSKERLTGFTVLPDGTFVISTVASSKKGDVNRLIFADGKSFKLKKALKISGFKKKNATIESLLATQDSKLLSIISFNSGTPPFDLAIIDIDRNRVNLSDELALPASSQNRRYSNLVQAPDGKIFATTLDSEGIVALVQIDLNNRALITGRGKIITQVELSFKNRNLANDLYSLAFSPSNELFAIAAPESEKNKSLFRVNLKTGEMNFIRKIQADKVAFVRF